MNTVGWSEESDLSQVNADVRVAPLKPLQTPYRDPASSHLQLVVYWDTLTTPTNGGSDIISYHLQYDDASNEASWTDLIGLTSDSLVTTFTVTSSIQIGSIYKFRYRAKNLFGWGPYSDVLNLYAAKVPETIDTVVTSNEGTNVRISWTPPSYNGGLPLISYRVYIEKQTIN